MDFATLPKDSVLNDNRGVSIEILNSTLECDLTSRQKGLAYEDSAPFKPVIKKGTYENLQLAHPNRKL